MAVFQNFYNTLNSKYSINDKLQRAEQFLKNNIDVGEAIVNIFGSTGIAGFKFHLPKREQVRLQSEITDQYTDLNRPIQDHIARKPVTIQLTGLQGEYFYSVNKVEDAIAMVTPALSLVKQYLPQLTDAAMAAKTLKTRLSAAIDFDSKIAGVMGKNYGFGSKVKSVWNELNGVDLFKTMQELYKLKSAQTRAYLFFEALWKSNSPFTVETTWKRYDNMLVQNITVIRDENADITDFTVECKQIEIAKTMTTNLNNYTGRTRQELSEISNKGVDKGKKVEV